MAENNKNVKPTYQKVHAVLRKAGFPSSPSAGSFPWRDKGRRGYRLWFGLGVSGNAPIHGMAVYWVPKVEAGTELLRICEVLVGAGFDARLREDRVYLRPHVFTFEAAKNFLHEGMNIYLVQGWHRHKGWVARSFDSPYEAEPLAVGSTWQEVFEAASGEPVTLT